MNDNETTYPEGHFTGLWMAIGIAIFSGLGIPLSIITHNYSFIAIGPALGVGFGLAIGQGIENKYKEQGRIRPLNESEKRRKKNAILAGVGMFSLGVLVFVLFNFL